ncbi:hypothetical protein [Ekhidna sp.]
MKKYTTTIVLAFLFACGDDSAGINYSFDGITNLSGFIGDTIFFSGTNFDDFDNGVDLIYTFDTGNGFGELGGLSSDIIKLMINTSP